jgi:hypothetical protein
MAKNPLPTLDLLRQLLDYDAETGTFVWRTRTPDLMRALGKSTHSTNWWNARYAGKEAGGPSGGPGYWQIAVGKRIYFAHRLAWLLHHGTEPIDEIDHINGHRADNRICNLREVSTAQNRKNQCISSHNTSGIIGVNWHKRDRRWRAFIKVNGRSVHLGNFIEVHEAIAARKSAEIRYGFHENHGRKPTHRLTRSSKVASA